MAAAPQKPLTGSAPGLSAMTNLAMIYCKAPFDPELSSGTGDPTFWGDGKTVFEDLSGNGNDLSTTVTIPAWPEVISAAFFLCEIHKMVDGDNKICNFARTRNNCL